MSKRSDRAADDFMRLLWPDRGPAGRDAWGLVRAAFALYEREWSDYRSRCDIEAWDWPAAQLADPAPFARGNEPWAVLLREAVRLRRAETQGGA